LDLGLHVLDGVVGFDVQSDGLSGESLDKNLHGTTTKAKNKVKRRLLLDVVVGQGTSVFKLLSSEDKSLLLWRNSFLVLDLCFDVLDGVVCFDVQGDGLSSKRLDEDLHGTPTKTKNKMESGLLLNVVVGEGSAIFELLSSENESLLLRWNSFLVLDLCFHVLDRVVGFDVQSDSLTGECLHKDLHGTTTKTKHKMKRGLLLDVVIGQGSSIFKLLSGKDESLLLRRDSFLILDFGLHVLDGVVGFDIQSDGLTGKRLDEDLHGTTTKSKDKVEGGLLLDVIVRKGSAIFELLSGEDESLLLRRDSFLILDLSLHILDSVVGFNVQSDGLSGKRLHEDLHGTTTKSKDKMEGRLLLDVVVRKGSAIFQLLSGEDKSLLLRRDSFLILDLGLHVLDGVVGFDVQSDGLSGESLDKNLHGTTTKAKNKVKRRLLLDVVVGQGTSVFKLLSSEDKSLLLWRNSFLVLDLCFDVLDGVVCFDVQGDGLSSKRLDEDLHGTPTKTKNKMESGLLLNVVVGEGSAIFELLSSENESLLLRWNSFLVLDLCFHVLDRVVGFDVQSDSLTGECLHKDLHGTTTKTKHKMKRGLLLDVVIGQGSSIFKLLSGKDESLLLRRDSFLILDFGLHVLDGVVGFDIQSDGLTGKRLDEDLHGTTTKSKDKVEGGLLLDVVVRKGSAIFELLSGEDKSLLLRRDSFLILDLGLHVLNGVVGFDVQSDGLSSECLDKDLHGTTTKTKNKVESGLFLDIVVRERTSIFELFSCENKSLLLWRNAFLVLDLCFHVLDCVVGFDVQSNGLSSERFDKNLHSSTTKTKDKVKCRLFLNVVVRQRASIFELFSSKDQSLLLWWDSFLVLNLCLHVLDSIVCFDIQSNGLSSECFHKDLHGTTSKTQDKMKSRFFLNVVVRKCSSIFKLFSCENESLLLRRNAFLVLNLRLDVLNCVIRFHVQGNCLPC